MFPALTLDRPFTSRSTAVLLALSSALVFPLAAIAPAAPVAAQSAAPPTLERVDGITHGPQLGTVTATSIRVWARTRRPVSFQVLCSTSPAPSDATLSDPVPPGWEEDATGRAVLTGLRPNTTAYSGLVKVGRVADTRVNGKVNSFLTLPSSADYVDPQLNPKGLFNFAFEIGTGNNQSNHPLPPTYARMLDELKDKIHFQIQNGDWLYELGRETTEAQWAEANGVTRLPRTAQLARGVAGVWENYKLYLQNEDLANFYREVPLFVTLDDHEILNDVTGSGRVG